MDGFALLSQDSHPHDGQSPRLRVTGGVAAGYVADHAVQPGTAMRIMTGAPVPPGADTVIQIELTHSDGPESEWVEILQEVVAGILSVLLEKICVVGKQFSCEEQRLDHGKLGYWPPWAGHMYL